MYSTRHIVKVCVLLFVGGICALSAFGQPLMLTQVVRSTNSIVNEFGVVLRGTDPFAYDFGITPEQGAVVHILMADGSTVYPPSTDGTPDPRNQLLGIAYVGRGVNPLQPHNGKFSAAISPRPPFGAQIFARVFNRPSTADSSFYADSVLFPISALEHEVFDIEVPITDQPLDDADSDSDGIHNSWEKSYGTNPNAADSDGDGVSDRDELLSGTAASDEQEYVRLDDVRYISATSLQIAWKSAANRLYRIQRADPADLASGFTEIAQVAGSGGPMTYIVGGVDANEPKWYRMTVESLEPLPFQD